MSSLDLRHWVFCSLGPVDPRSPVTIQEDHVQGQGLCLTKASITLTGTYRPVAGSPISLAYSDGTNWIARVPRRLRVLSSQVDPLEGITTISAGCLLTYHSNRKPPVNIFGEKEENYNYPESLRRIAVLPMSAAWVVGKIFDELGLTAANGIPFNVKRAVDQWDMSAGYVEELGKIAQSEGYFAWVNESEQIEFIGKRSDPSGPKPLLVAHQILEMSPINSGDLPGDEVQAKFKYSRFALNWPDEQGEPSEEEVKRRNWEREVSDDGVATVIHTYTDASGQTVKELVAYNQYSISETVYDDKDRVVLRKEISNTLNGITTTETTFTYGAGVSDGEDTAAVKEEQTITTGPRGDLLASCGANGPHAATFLEKGYVVTGWRNTTYDKDADTGITQTKTIAATQYVNTPHGSDAISRLREAGEDIDNLVVLAGRIVKTGAPVRIRTEREFGLQRRPGQQSRNKAAFEKVTPAENSTNITWAMGSPASRTAIDLSPPYVSDDQIVVSNSPPYYKVALSDAQIQSLAYAQTENRLLLGNRNGQGLQLHPLDMPAKPFDALYLRINGCTACYRINGSTWTLAADGIRCTTDALFWAAIDGTTAAAWFPLPPGITTLPAAAAITTNANPLPANAMAIPAGFNPLSPNLTSLFAALPVGQAPVPRATINPTRFVKPYNATYQLRTGVRVGTMIRTQRWLPKTIQLATGVRVGAMCRIASMVGTSTGAVLSGQTGTLTQVGGFTEQAALILHFDGTSLVDSSSNGYTVTATGNAALSTVQSKFGGKSLGLDGFDGFAEATGAELAVSVGNWTVQAWIWISAGNFDERCIVQFGSNYTAGLFIYPSGGDNLVAWLDDGLTFAATSAPIPDETWVHVLASKENDTVRVFVNGVKSTANYVMSTSTTTGNITSTNVRIGGSDDYSAIFDGYIDDVVIEPGRVVDANFTPPTAAYPNP